MIDERLVRERAPHWFTRNRPPLKDTGGDDTSGGMTTSAANLESRLTRLEGAAVAAFVFLIVTFGGGYVLLSNQLNATTARLESKMDTIIGDLSDVKSGVAVLEERTKK